MTDLITQIVATGANTIEVWEPLKTKAPNPSLARPHCCYINTVIFYVRPWILRQWHTLWQDGRGRWRADKPGGRYEEWDRADTELTWDSVVEFNGAEYVCGGGRVVWHKRRWWMKRFARRKMHA